MEKDMKVYWCIKATNINDNTRQLLGPEWDTEDEAMLSLADSNKFPLQRAISYKVVKILEEA